MDGADRLSDHPAKGFKREVLDMKTKALLAAWVFAGPALAGDLFVGQVSAPATLQRGGSGSALLPQEMLEAGDIVSAGPRGRVLLRFGGGSMTLSSLGDLQVFDAKAPRGKAVTGKFKLLAGALRVDSRAAAGAPAQDVRLNIGSLKVRILAADAWGANTAEGDTICVMAGQVGVQTQGSSEERLDRAGDCLRREPDGRLRQLTLAEDELLAAAVAATRIERGAAPLPASPVPVIVAAPAPQTAPTSSPTMAGDWTVVVLSLNRPEPVTTRVQKLQEQGLPATGGTAEVKGLTMHRVLVGSFGSREEARAYAATTLAPRGIQGWPAKR
jgi:cell division septation protein DedD